MIKLTLLVRKHRGTASLAMCGFTAVVCVAIAVWSPAGVVANAVLVLLISLVGFHAVAGLSYEHKLAWQGLDYALEAITVISLVGAMAGIQQSAVTEVLQPEFARRKADQASFIYATKSTIVNDCHPKESRMIMWKPSPEPYPGACDRIEHFLPQLEYSFGTETGIESMTDDVYLVTDFVVNNAGASGSWRGLYEEANKFLDGTRRTRAVLDTESGLSSGFTKALAGSGKLRYWQYLLLFTLGLHIARKSAGIWARDGQEVQDDEVAADAGDEGSG
jgi:hypothetical protein